MSHTTALSFCTTRAGSFATVTHSHLDTATIQSSAMYGTAFCYGSMQKCDSITGKDWLAHCHHILALFIAGRGYYDMESYHRVLLIRTIRSLFKCPLSVARAIQLSLFSDVSQRTTAIFTIDGVVQSWDKVA